MNNTENKRETVRNINICSTEIQKISMNSLGFVFWIDKNNLMITFSGSRTTRLLVVDAECDDEFYSVDCGKT